MGEGGSAELTKAKEIQYTVWREYDEGRHFIDNMNKPLYYCIIYNDIGSLKKIKNKKNKLE